MDTRVRLPYVVGSAAALAFWAWTQRMASQEATGGAFFEVLPMMLLLGGTAAFVAWAWQQSHNNGRAQAALDGLERSTP